MRRHGQPSVAYVLMHIMAGPMKTKECVVQLRIEGFDLQFTQKNGKEEVRKEEEGKDREKENTHMYMTNSSNRHNLKYL